MKKRFILLSIIFFALLCVLINQNFIKYVYVSPEVNTSVLKPITKAIKPIEKKFKIIMDACQKEHKNMNYAYINYYGSGFLKENKLPNDLDISVGVDLGTYKFNGENFDEITKDIIDKIEVFHLYTNAAFISDKKVNYVVNKPEMEQFTELQQKRNESFINIKDGLQQVLDGKVQILHFNKKYKIFDVDYTFILNPNEVLINDLTPFFAYTKGIIYNKNMVDYPREVTILPDFYVTIKNIKTNETQKIELIEESFMGERFQLSRRFFVPIVFTGNHSLKHIKKLDYLNDDKKYIETRMFNFFRYLNEVELYFDFTVDNVKLIKRLHQCVDIISPALTEDEKNKIYSDISSVLSNKDIKLANDYTVPMRNFSVLTANEYLFRTAIKYNYINELIQSSNNALNELAKNEKYKQEINNLKLYQYEYLSMMNKINSAKKLEELHKYLDDKFIDISVNITKIVNSNIENRQKFIDDYNILKNVFDKAGFHKIEVYQYDMNHIYVVKDDFTKNLTPSDLKSLAEENNMPDAEYKLIDASSLNKGSRSELKYVRFNSTNAENQYWQELQNKLLDDKKNYKIKRKYVF